MATLTSPDLEMQDRNLKRVFKKPEEIGAKIQLPRVKILTPLRKDH